MHRWLLFVLVLLLPLRGLAGAAMAGQVLQHAAAPVAAVATDHRPHHGMAPQAGHDCDEHHHAGLPAASAEVTAEPPGDCPTCASCQVCSSVVLAPSLWPVAGEALPQAPPQVAVQALASAEPALVLKPPRS